MRLLTPAGSRASLVSIRTSRAASWNRSLGDPSESSALPRLNVKEAKRYQQTVDPVRAATAWGPLGLGRPDPQAHGFAQP